MCSFYQDRLGTNIGKTQKQTVFLQSKTVVSSDRAVYDDWVQNAFTEGRISEAAATMFAEF